MKQKLKQYFEVVLGLFLSAVSFNLFLVPYDFVPGGVGGLAIIFKRVVGFDETLFILTINFFLIIISFYYLGKEQTKNTILGTILFPLFVSITKDITNWIEITNVDYLLIAMIGGIINGFAVGLVFKNGFTTGGTDILNQIMEKYLKIPISTSFFYIDGAIVLLSGIVFGISNMVYSIIVLYLISYMTNKTMIEMNYNKIFYIQTKKLQDIKKFLTKNYSYDLTILETIGGFSNQKGTLLICSVHRKDYYAIKEEILLIDPEVFLTITNTYEQKNANQLIRNTNKINTPT